MVVGFACAVLAVVLIVQSSGILGADETSANAVFEDVPLDHPHRVAIEQATQLGLLQPASDTLFGPAEPVTREKLAGSLVRLMEWSVAQDEEEVFSDVEGDPEQLDDADYVAVVAQRSVMSGTADDPPAFKPAQQVSLETFVVVLNRAFANRLSEPAIRNPDIDARPVTEEVREALQRVNAAGLFRDTAIDLGADDLTVPLTKDVAAEVLANAHRELSGG